MPKTKEKIVIIAGEVSRNDDSKNGWGQYEVYEADTDDCLDIAVPADINEEMDGNDIQEGDELRLSEGPKGNWILTVLPNEEPQSKGRSSNRSGGGGNSRSSSGSSNRRGRSSGGSSRSSSSGSNRKSSTTRRSGGGGKSDDGPDVNTLIKYQEYMKICASVFAVDPQEFENNLLVVIDGAKTIDKELNG